MTLTVQSRSAETAAGEARQNERLAAIGVGLSAVSHEVRNELYALRTGLDLLAASLEGNGQALEWVGHLQETQRRLRRLFDDIRSFAAPLPLDRSPCAVDAVWRRAWDRLERGRNGRAVKFRETVEGTAGCLADELRLEQVFRNLFENSLAACSDPLQIDLHCRPAYTAAGRALCIRVRDNGPGLDEHTRAHLFDAFFTTSPKGTGLGMTIVRRIVEAHGGSIAAGTAPGGGAEFVITLPSALSVPH